MALVGNLAEDGGGSDQYCPPFPGHPTNAHSANSISGIRVHFFILIIAT